MGTIDLRAYVFLDSLQAQYAAFLGTVAQGFLPLAGDASLSIEVSPGIGARTGGVYDNPLDGWSSVMRDELGEVRHTRGTVAMMSNGHDLVNGQFFINLIDRPDLDHGYTVFGRIVSGLENADKILQGTRITRLTLTER